MREKIGQLPLPQRVDAAISSTLLDTGYRQVGRTWMRLREPDDHHLSTALALQPAKYDRTRFYIMLSFFAGQNPPQTPEEWVARRHAVIRFEHMRHILKALHEEPQPDLPKDLTIRDDPDEALRDTKQIAQTAKMVFEKIETPDDLLTLADHLEKIEPDLSAILHINVSGQQALGIS